MKALEILKKIYANNPDTRFQRNNIDINFTIHDFSNVNEAIKELEALENRSCEGCKHCRQFAELGLCDVLRGYTNMHLIKYCGSWVSK